MTSATAPVIRTTDLTKRFHYWSERPSTLKTLLVNLARGKFNFGEKQEFLAFEGVSFEIGRGEFVGIMGRNGAGKSTLLKLLSGIYTPTRGKVEIHGRIAPLIELGAGFHPDLSGYENIFLNASILGFGRKDTMAALPKILEFAEIGEKIYMPVKKYSSGMLVRLGFAVATHLDSEILLVDEVLAVGDAGFREKCLNKIEELHRAGRTIVLVTHNPEQVRDHCSRCIVIGEQKKLYDGPPEGGVSKYLEATHAHG